MSPPTGHEFQWGWQWCVWILNEHPEPYREGTPNQYWVNGVLGEDPQGGAQGGRGSAVPSCPQPLHENSQTHLQTCLLLTHPHPQDLRPSHLLQRLLPTAHSLPCYLGFSFIPKLCQMLLIGKRKFLTEKKFHIYIQDAFHYSLCTQTEKRGAALFKSGKRMFREVK